MIMAIRSSATPKGPKNISGTKSIGDMTYITAKIIVFKFCFWEVRASCVVFM